MPFKPPTAKKYARLILQWVLPIAFALIVLNGAYRGFTVDSIPMSLVGFYYVCSGLITISVIGLLVWGVLGAFLSWVYETDQD